jgi:enoyl-CoA hydratase
VALGRAPPVVALGRAPAAVGRPLSTAAGAAAAPSEQQQLVTTRITPDGVAVVTLNDPKRLNALTVDMGAAFQAALRGIDWAAANAVVLTGAGRAFSAGGDLAFLTARSRDSPSRNAQIMRSFYERFVVTLRREVPVPVIAAINGPAIGAGLCLALGCDLRVAGAGAALGITFVGIGLHPGMGATHFLPRLVGPQVAARMCLTGETITGEEAARLGLVLEAVPGAPDDVLPRALDLAGRIAAQAPVAVRTATRTLRLAGDDGLDRALWREADAQAQCYAGPDLAEGVAAVAAKRRPSWREHLGYRE